MNIQEIISLIWLNIKIIIIFFGVFFVLCIAMYFIYNMCLRKKPLLDSLNDSVKFFELLLKFDYPILNRYSFSSMKQLLAKVFIPISQLNMFWTTTTNFQLNNIEYESKKGTIKFNELILAKDQIEILYNVTSENDNFDLVKDKDKNKLIINSQEYKCHIDTVQKKISVNCSGYYIFNDSKVIFQSKIKYDKNIFRIEINTSDFFNYGEQYSIKDLINICKFLCQLCFGCCCIIVSFICVCVNIKIVFSAMVINFFVIRRGSGFMRRIFDIYSEMKNIQ